MPEKKRMDLEILKEVIQIMKDDDISEVCIEQDGIRVEVKRGMAQSSEATQGAAILESHEQQAGSLEEESSLEDSIVVPSPMVGIFYLAPSPGAEPFVNVGDEVKAGQVICIIEAMKLMNEITADVDGQIVEIILEDGQAVEYAQPMFRIKPK
jgi:acetyl-CoA carboxylase biotin carboxyl carrier protein